MWTLIGVVVGPSQVARAAGECTASLCVLNASAANALYVHPGSVQVTGSILVNSTNSQAALVSGTTTVTAIGGTIGGPAAPAGFTTSGGGSYNPAPTNQSAATDPYAALAQCPAAAACPTTPAAPYPSINHLVSGTQTINPGVYTNITNLAGTLALNPGTYVVTGGITISSGKLTGTGVTIYLACPTYPTACAASTSGASFTDQTGGKTTLSAPTTGAFTGFSLIADRNNTATVTVSGNGSWLTGGGAIYTAAGKLTAASGGKSSFTRAVVDTVETSGSNASQISVIPTNGTLSISVPTTAGLGSAAPAGTVSAALGTVTITDQRGLITSTWTATVTATNFTTGGATSAETITTTNVSYWSGAATNSTGTVTVTPGQADASAKQALNSARTAFSSTGNGNSSTTWNPTVVITLPAPSVVGTYTGTITHSVA